MRVVEVSGKTVDEAVARVRDGARSWARAPAHSRIALARSLQAGLTRVAERSVLLACEAKGLSPDEPAAGEERFWRAVAAALDSSGLDPQPDNRTSASATPAAGMSTGTFTEEDRGALRGRGACFSHRAPASAAQAPRACPKTRAGGRQNAR